MALLGRRAGARASTDARRGLRSSRFVCKAYSRSPARRDVPFLHPRLAARAAAARGAVAFALPRSRHPQCDLAWRAGERSVASALSARVCARPVGAKGQTAGTPGTANTSPSRTTAKESQYPRGRSTAGAGKQSAVRAVAGRSLAGRAIVLRGTWRPVAGMVDANL